MKLFKFLLIFLLISFSNLQCPSWKVNPVVTDCTSKSSSNTHCCMLSSPGYNPTETMCYEVPSNKYRGQNIEFYNDTTYKLDCGNAKVKVVKGNTCGNINPLYRSDCWSFSNDQSSCCFFLSQNTTGIPGCQWLGEKKSGNVLISPNDLMLNCSISLIKVHLVTLVVLLSMLFI